MWKPRLLAYLFATQRRGSGQGRAAGKVHALQERWPDRFRVLPSESCTSLSGMLHVVHSDFYPFYMWKAAMGHSRRIRRVWYENIYLAATDIPKVQPARKSTIGSVIAPCARSGNICLRRSRNPVPSSIQAEINGPVLHHPHTHRLIDRGFRQKRSNCPDRARTTAEDKQTPLVLSCDLPSLLAHFIRLSTEEEFLSVRPPRELARQKRVHLAADANSRHSMHSKQAISKGLDQSLPRASCRRISAFHSHSREAHCGLLGVLQAMHARPRPRFSLCKLRPGSTTLTNRAAGHRSKFSFRSRHPKANEPVAWRTPERGPAALKSSRSGHDRAAAQCLDSIRCDTRSWAFWLQAPPATRICPPWLV
ncbi:hypothetical protein FN846DRAFT_46526 [Sphaerosporella brunnea]|uniref:Uncharacterized protein n=1 Tax=Sphaerosporella brunnea TaxID=1250544 RepID=A0A5J5EV08_9PEZI|nr:hypothetical protein FN846DRAFT_46526 [Sphaerosporella brunnea]